MKTITKNLRWLVTLLAMIVSVGAWADDTFKLYTGEITEGDYIICNGGKAMKAEEITVSYVKRLNYEELTLTDNNKIITSNASIIWHIAQSGNYWTIYNANVRKYVYSAGSKYQAQLSDNGTSDNELWTIDDNYVFKLKKNRIYYPYLNFNAGFGCSDESYSLSLYKKVTVAKPTFSPAQGEETGRPFNLTISCSTTGAKIYYTTDGITTPSASTGTLYTQGDIIRISSSKTIKAIAIDEENGVSSEVATATYSISPITTIPDVETLVAFRETVNGGVNYTNETVTLTNNISVSGWTESIGTEEHPFTGTFEGKDEYNVSHSITLSGSTGLFGVTDGATIENLTLIALIENTDDNAKVATNSGKLEETFDLETVTPKDNEVYTGGYGGIVNHAKNSTIENCAVTGSIQYNSSNNVGGIVGRLETTTGSCSVRNCDVTADINGHRCTGGIVGAIYGNGTSTIENCGFMVKSDQFPNASASMTANLCTGGIVGFCFSPAVISKCFNHVNIGSNGDVKGGIVGIAQAQNKEAITIESCYNKGEVHTSNECKYAGGIVGVANNTSISYCYNANKIESPGAHGGIAAVANKSEIKNCYNVGIITTDGNHGPIISSAITNAGGSAGYIPEITHCYYLSSTAAGDNLYTGSAISKEVDDLKSWNLYGGGDDKIGLGIASDGDSRKWVFVRENYPLLYEVRGQEISLKGNSGRNKTSSDVSVYATFSSDVAFTCDEAYWAQRIDTYYGTKIFVFQQTSILYPSVGENYQKGYMLRTTNNTTEFKLVYRPTTEIGRVVNRYLNYKPFNYVTGDYDAEVPNTETTICEENFMYGVGKKTSYNNLYKDDRTIFYLSGNKVGNDTYAVFKKLTPNNSSSIGDNKTYLLANPNELSVEGSAKTMFNISFNEFVEPEVLLGDVDVDGAVTVTDVVKMVNVVLNESADDVIMKHGDVNGDGDLDVADVVAIVNKVLGVENDVKSRKVNSVANGGDEASLELNDGVVDFLLSNSSAFCAFQFYMNAEDGLDCESIILSARAKGHTVSMNKLSDGRYKVMCYSGVNKSFDGSEGELFNIMTSGASGKLTLENLFFVTPGASKVKFGNMDIDVVPTGISSIDADANVNANTIFDLSGRRVQKVQKGVYIVNGKKVIL